MEESTTHIPGEKILVDLANREHPDAALNLAIHRSLGGKAVSWERLVAGLSRLAAELLDNLLSGKRVIVWAMRPAFYQIVLRGGSHVFEEAVDGADRFVAPGWKVAGEFEPGEVRAILEIFDGLREGVDSIDGQRLGKCPICSRYFVSLRSGERKSRACSKAHQAVLVARELRSSERYREREKARNARRMAAVREAQKLVRRWIEEGLPSKEREKRLLEWNTENGSALGKRAFYGILEKGG